ncbi:MAG: sugar-binding protein [Planctomycetota bacterium]
MPGTWMRAVVGALIAFSALAATGQGANLLTNPSFEAAEADGTPGEWPLRRNLLPGQTGEAKVALGGPAHSGRSAAQLSFGDGVEWAYISQTRWMLLAADDEHLFSAWLRSEKPARVSIVLFALGTPPAPGEKTLEIQKREWVDTGPEWKRCATGATIDRAGAYVRLWCVVQLHTPGVTLSVDDAELLRVNAPTAAPSSGPVRSVGCVRTAEPPVIDGKLDDTCWKRAGIADGFSNLRRMRDSEPTQKTLVALLYDDDALYLGYRCFESELGAVKAEKKKRDDGIWSDDCIEAFLLPPDSSFPGIAVVGPRYYHLLVNSLGTQGDDVGLPREDQWSGKWEAAAGRESDAWTVEMKIPFRELDSRPAPSAPWKVNFTRTEKRLGENSSWADLKDNFHDPERFGEMFFVTEPGEAAVIVAATAASQATRLRAGWAEELAKTISEADQLAPLLRASSASRSAEIAAKLAEARRAVQQTNKNLAALAPEEVVKRKTDLQDEIEEALATCNPLLNAAAVLAQGARRAFLLYPAAVITNERILPTSLMSACKPAQALELSAAPGEYESTTFVLVPSRDVAGVTVTCAGLRSSSSAIDPSHVDVKLVECWYQACAEGGSFQRGKVLVPELLVNDNDLVRVDLAKKQNLLRVTDPSTGETRYEDVTAENEKLTPDLVIRDAPGLLPVAVTAGRARQFWVTVHVPPDAPPGTYAGELIVRCEGAERALPLALVVHPFRLAPPVLEYSIYYRGRLVQGEHPSIESDPKTREQYEAEIRDMVAHGVDAPLVYQGTKPLDLMEQALTVRQRAGVSTERFFLCSWGVGPKDSREGTRATLGSVMDLARSFGYREFYNYGPDEPSIERVREQVGSWKFLHEIGWKVYLACNVLTDSTKALRRDLWDEVKGSVDAFVVGGPPNVELARTLRDAGVRLYSYDNPQCGIEVPLTFRRNFGLLLWKAGYSGAMDYAYQHGFGRHIWNDFDANPPYNYRDHLMAYPTSDGVVGTLEWEGFREGADDVRYLSTLLGAIEDAKKDPARAARAKEIETWTQRIDPSGDLDDLRSKIVEHILELSEGK